MFKDDRNYIGVRFFQGNGVMSTKMYTYWTKSKKVKEGDLAVVAVGSEYKVVKVCDVDLTETRKASASKWVVGVVKDENARESTKKDLERDTLKKQLRVRMEELLELQGFEELSKKDKRMRKLMKKFKKLEE